MTITQLQTKDAFVMGQAVVESSAITFGIFVIPLLIISCV